MIVIIKMIILIKMLKKIMLGIIWQLNLLLDECANIKSPKNTITHHPNKILHDYLL